MPCAPPTGVANSLNVASLSVPRKRLLGPSSGWLTTLPEASRLDRWTADDAFGNVWTNRCLAVGGPKGATVLFGVAAWVKGLE